MNRYLKLLLVTGIIFCCTKDDKLYKFKTSSKKLNEFISTSKVQVINLDEANSLYIDLALENVIYSIDNFVKDDAPILGHLSSVVQIDEFFYVQDMPTQSVYKINKNGEIVDTLATPGRGPGEVASIGGIYFNSDHIFLPDVNNGRVNRYSHLMKVEEAFNSYSMSGFDVSDHFIFSINRNANGFYPKNTNEGLIVVTSTFSLSDTIKTLMPRIIDDGYQPQVFNSVKFSSNQSGQLVASYRPIPWLFIFDENQNHLYTLVLGYTAFDTLNVPKMDQFKPIGNKGYGGQIPIHSYKLMDSGDIFVNLRNEILHLKNNDGEYTVINKVRFNKTFDSENTAWTWVFNKVINVTDDYLYIFNPEYIFKVEYKH